MDVRDCLQMLREIKDVAFATVDEDGCPQVRIIGVMLVEGERLYFLTARGKAFYHQLEGNGRVAVTGLNKEWQSVRLCGKARRLAERTSWISRMFQENPSMEDVYPGDSRDILEAFVIDEGELELFDLGKSSICRQTFFLTPQKEAVSSGDLGTSVLARTSEAIAVSEAAEGKGFRITEACVDCGRCAAVCPQKAIQQKGEPRASSETDQSAVRSKFPIILQEHCLHCGLCFECCPVEAIVRRNGK